MNNPPFFSFVIPAYKLQYLSETLDSILGQTCSEFELIVVNDKSPENIKGLVDAYSDPRIIYYENEQNMGRADLVASWNHALSYAKGEYVVLASDDDVYSADFLEQAKALISLHPECNLIRGRVAKTMPTGEPYEEECAFEPCLTQERFSFYLLRHGYKCAANYIYKRTVLNERGGLVNFPCAWYTDTATPLMMADKGALCLPNVSFFFRSSDIQLSANYNIQVLQQKLSAIEQYQSWAESYFAQLQNTLLVQNARSLTRKDICHMLTDHMQFVPLRNIKMWKKFIYGNPTIYKYEKAMAVVGRLLHHFKR